MVVITNHTSCFAYKYFNHFKCERSIGPIYLYPLLKNNKQNNKEIVLSVQLGLLVAGYLTDSITFFIISLLIGLACNLSPIIENGISRTWLFIGQTIGQITKTIILTIIYYLLLTPLGLLKRIFTRDQYHFYKAPAKSAWQRIDKLYDSEDLANPW